VAAALTTLGVALTGAVVLGAAPAQAKLRETDFGFQTTAYGTRVMAKQVDLRSARTAFSYISCTRLTGRRADRRIAEVGGKGTPLDGVLHVGAVTSHSRTYRAKHGRVVGVRSVNQIAGVTIGDPGANQPHLGLGALTTTAKAWHVRGKGFRTSTNFDGLDLELNLAPGTPIEGPLQQLTDAVSGGLDQVLELLGSNQFAKSGIEIPGLGTIKVGHERNTKKKGYAAASAYALKIDLVNGSTVALGRAWARITKNVPAGVFHGVGYGAQVSAVDGILKVGRVVTRALPCQGTHGKVRTSHLAGLDLGAAGVLKVGAASARSYGIQRKSGYARGWTEGQVAGIEIGTGDTKLVINALKARAKVVKTKSGKVRKSAAGTTIGSGSFGGQKIEFPDAGAVPLPKEAQGVLKLEVNKVHRFKRGINVVALQITLLPGTPAETVVKLGGAHVRIKRV
jgi:hypothetical protein